MDELRQQMSGPHGGTHTPEEPGSLTHVEELTCSSHYAHKYV